jgi:hypothetical protein
LGASGDVIGDEESNGASEVGPHLETGKFERDDSEDEAHWPAEGDEDDPTEIVLEGDGASAASFAWMELKPDSERGVTFLGLRFLLAPESRRGSSVGDGGGNGKVRSISGSSRFTTTLTAFFFVLAKFSRAVVLRTRLCGRGGGDNVISRGGVKRSVGGSYGGISIGVRERRVLPEDGGSRKSAFGFLAWGDSLGLRLESLCDGEAIDRVGDSKAATMADFLDCLRGLGLGVTSIDCVDVVLSVLSIMSGRGAVGALDRLRLGPVVVAIVKGLRLRVSSGGGLIRDLDGSEILQELD